MKAKELPTINQKAKELPTKNEIKRQEAKAEAELDAEPATGQEVKAEAELGAAQATGLNAKSKTELGAEPATGQNAKTETGLNAISEIKNEAELDTMFDAELEAALEEERKKKKNKEAANYFLAAQDDKLKAARDAAAFEKFSKSQSDFWDFLTQEERKKFPQIAAEYAAIVERADIVKNLRMDFFSIKNHPQAEEIKNDLKRINLQEKDFSAIALCAAEDKMEAVQKHLANEYKKRKKIKVSREVFTDKEIKEVKSSSVEKARRAIADAAHGDPKKLARLLKAGLENCCKRFADKKITTAKAMEWSENAAEILFVLEQNPGVKKTCGLTDSQLECARLTADMGMEIRSGMQAIELLSQVHQQGSKLPEYKMDNLKEKVFQMHLMTFDRSKYIKMWDEPKMEIPQIQNPVR